MFTIYRHQIKRLDKNEEKKFIKRTLSWLKANYENWANDKTDKELISFIYSMINFGEQFSLKKEWIYIELMVLEVEKSMLSYFPFSDVIMMLLRNKKRSEYFKIEMIQDLIVLQNKDNVDG